MRLAYVGCAALLAFMLHPSMTADAQQVTHIVRSGETLRGIARQYAVPLQTLVEANKMADPDRLAVAQRLVIPGGQPASPPPKPDAVAQSAMSEVLPGFLWPVKGRISSGYGHRKHPILKRYHFHQGIDIAAPYGMPIVAARDGLVIFSGMKKQAGRVVILEHENGFATVYAHTALNLVEIGETVRAGEKIALIGRSGLTTGAHLYFEVWREGRHINPMFVLTDELPRVADVKAAAPPASVVASGRDGVSGPPTAMARDAVSDAIPSASVEMTGPGLSWR